MSGKPWYKSKTVWFSVLYVIVAVAGLFGYAEFEPAPELVTGVGAALVIIKLIIDLFLRSKTSEPIFWA